MLDKDIYNSVKSVALANNLEPALLLAVIDVESSGSAFWSVDGTSKPVVRFEGHYFYARLKGDKLARAVKEGLASPKVGGVPNPSTGSARYQLIERAKLIDKDAALESCSWGLGQVMGANWTDLGYSSVDELVSAANTVDGQIDMIMKFIDHNGLTPKLRKKDWKGFAKSYNGSGYSKGAYDRKLAEAYQKYLVTPTDDLDVLQMQKMLNVVGKYGLTVDGVLGKTSSVALKDFQLKNGLHDDGLYGPLTKQKLEAKYLELSNKAQHQFGGGIASMGAAGAALSEAAKQIQPLTSMSQTLQWVFVGLVVIGVVITAYTLFFKKASVANA